MLLPFALSAFSISSVIESMKRFIAIDYAYVFLLCFFVLF